MAHPVIVLHNQLFQQFVDGLDIRIQREMGISRDSRLSRKQEGNLFGSEKVDEVLKTGDIRINRDQHTIRSPNGFSHHQLRREGANEFYVPLAPDLAERTYVTLGIIHHDDLHLSHGSDHLAAAKWYSPAPTSTPLNSSSYQTFGPKRPLNREKTEE